MKKHIYVTPFRSAAIAMFKHHQNNGRTVSMRRQECNARVWEVVSF